MQCNQASSTWRVKRSRQCRDQHWRIIKIFTAISYCCLLGLILHIIDKQVTLIACASRHSICATACWPRSGNCVVLMTKRWMIATSYYSVCNRPCRSSLSFASVQSATVGLLESGIFSSGGKIFDKDSLFFLLVWVPGQYPFNKQSNWLAKIIQMCNFKFQFKLEFLLITEINLGSWNSVSIAIRLWTEWFRVWIRAGFRNFSILQNIQADSGTQSASQSMDTGILTCGYSGQDMTLTTRLHLVLKLRMSLPIPLFPLYAFLTWAGATLPLAEKKFNCARPATIRSGWYRLVFNYSLVHLQVEKWNYYARRFDYHHFQLILLSILLDRLYSTQASSSLVCQTTIIYHWFANILW